MSVASGPGIRTWRWTMAAPVVVPLGASLALLLIPLAGLPPPGRDSATSRSCSRAGTATTVAGIELDAGQMAQAQTIAEVAATVGLGPDAATVALATAWQESRLRMLA